NWIILELVRTSVRIVQIICRHTESVLAPPDEINSKTPIGKDRVGVEIIARRRGIENVDPGKAVESNDVTRARDRASDHVVLRSVKKNDSGKRIRDSRIHRRVHANDVTFYILRICSGSAD